MNDKHCQGCGILLQDQNVLQEGYTTSLDNDLCQRCFRMRNYGEYQVVVKSNEEYLKILETVSKTNDLVVYVTDLLNLEKNLAIERPISAKKSAIFWKKLLIPRAIALKYWRTIPEKRSIWDSNTSTMTRVIPPSLSSGRLWRPSSQEITILTKRL